MDRFKKREISLRYWLLGRGYTRALEAMDFAARYHTGTRKDGVTPEFDHQISIVHYLRTLPDLMYPEETLMAGFLHDVPEDFDVARDEIARRFTPQVAISVECMTKKRKGIKRNAEEVFASIAQDPIASIVKPGDRGHNFNSMVGVFTPEKQLDYVAEGSTHFLPMIKQARRLFPQQERAYENVKHLLVTQMDMVRAMHKDI